MPELRVKITTPSANESVGRNITVEGTLTVIKQQSEHVDVTDVSVQFGQNGQIRPATKLSPNWKTWRCTGSPPLGSTGGSPLTITAMASGQQRPDGPHDPH